ncbi:MAG: class I SAM-dependent methyltransferase family protein [Acidilobaceae archaeon]
MRSQCVEVNKFNTERVVKILSFHRVIDRRFKFSRVDDKVCIPVVDASRALEVLAREGIEARVTSAELKPITKPKPLGELFRGLSSYSIIGDIIVFNWRSEIPDVEVYKSAALHIMSEQPRIKVALLKYETWGEVRAQRIEHLAGENRTRTIHKEYGLLFHVDLAKVYFNPRLATEHRRIAEEVSDNEIILDMFSGVGGYSIHIASLRKAKVVSADLNIHAVRLLAENIRENKRKLVGEIVALRADATLLPLILKPVFNRIIMDHPTASKYFIGEACRLASREAYIVYYTRTINCNEAIRELEERATMCCKRVDIDYCRRVLEYSPSQSIFSIQARTIGRGY